MGRKLKSYAEWRHRQNMVEYSFYFKYLKRILISMFTWKNLPNGISERFIEEKLFNNGLVVFTKHDGGFPIVAQANPMRFNTYEEPTNFHIYGLNGLSGFRNLENCVPIYNDILMEGNTANVHYFAKKISNVEKTREVNLEQLKNPYIISCPENQKETVRQVIEHKTEGVPYIFTSDDFSDMVKVNVFNLNITNHTQELEELKRNILNESLTFFGIKNVDVQKRERLTKGETENNDEQLEFNVNSMLSVRKKAVEKINKMFGTNISVELYAKAKEIQNQNGSEENV